MKPPRFYAEHSGDIRVDLNDLQAGGHASGSVALGKLSIKIIDSENGIVRLLDFEHVTITGALRNYKIEELKNG